MSKRSRDIKDVELKLAINAPVKGRCKGHSRVGGKGWERRGTLTKGYARQPTPTLRIIIIIWTL